MSAIRSALDELAVTPDEELTTAELQEELAELEAAHEIARTLLIRKAQRLFELMPGKWLMPVLPSRVAWCEPATFADR